MTFQKPAEVIALAEKASTWEDIDLIDPYQSTVDVTPYPSGLLPKVFEDFARQQCTIYGGAMEYYAGSFSVIAAGMLSSGVQLQLSPLDPFKLVKINDLTMLIGPSATGKTPTHQKCRSFVEQWESTLYREHKDKMARAAEAARADGEKLSKEFIDPRSKHVCISTGTIERWQEQMALNEGLPLTICPEEASGALIQPGAHRSEAGYRLLGDLLNNLYDNGHSTITKQTKDIRIDCYYGNLYTATTPEALSMWKDLESAMYDGLLGRINMIMHNPTERFKRDSNYVYNSEINARWEQVLIALRGLSGYILAPPINLAGRINDMLKQYQHEAMIHYEVQPALSSWLKKLETRLMRYAALFTLINFIEDPSSARTRQKVDTVLEIQEHNLVAAAEYINRFLFPQQEYFYRTFAGASEYNRVIRHLFNKILGDGLKSITRDDLVGSKSMRSIRNWDDRRRGPCRDRTGSR